MNKPEAEQIAQAVALIRPKWLQSSLVTALGNLPKRHRDKPARDVHLALLWLAYDPAQDTPRLLREDGPWWNLASLTGPGTTTPAAAGIVTICEHDRPGVSCAECHPRDRVGVPMPAEMREKIRGDILAGQAAIEARTFAPGASW